MLALEGINSDAESLELEGAVGAGFLPGSWAQELSPRRPWCRSTAAPRSAGWSPRVKTVHQAYPVSPHRLGRFQGAFPPFPEFGKLGRGGDPRDDRAVPESPALRRFSRGREKKVGRECTTQSPAGGRGSKAVSQGLPLWMLQGRGPGPEKAKGGLENRRLGIQVSGAPLLRWGGVRSDS